MTAALPRLPLTPPSSRFGHAARLRSGGGALANGIFTAEQAERLRSAMNIAFPDSLVTNHESIIAGMKNDDKNRHVAAVAVKVGAQVIVTMNLSDFRDLPDGIEAQHPDTSRRRFFMNTSVGDIDESGILPGCTAFASPVTSPNTFGVPGCAAKSSISSLSNTPVHFAARQPKE